MLLNVCVPAQVSVPAVSQMCLSPEQMSITCSSRGDEVEFNLTLDGHSLMETGGHGQSQKNWPANRQPLAGSKTEDKSSTSAYPESSQDTWCVVFGTMSAETKQLFTWRAAKVPCLKGAFFLSTYNRFTNISHFFSPKFVFKNNQLISLISSCRSFHLRFFLVESVIWDLKLSSVQFYCF